MNQLRHLKRLCSVDADDGDGDGDVIVGSVAVTVVGFVELYYIAGCLVAD